VYKKVNRVLPTGQEREFCDHGPQIDDVFHTINMIPPCTNHNGSTREKSLLHLTFTPNINFTCRGSDVVSLLQTHHIGYRSWSILTQLPRATPATRGLVRRGWKSQLILERASLLCLCPPYPAVVYLRSVVWSFPHVVCTFSFAAQSSASTTPPYRVAKTIGPQSSESLKADIVAQAKDIVRSHDSIWLSLG